MESNDIKKARAQLIADELADIGNWKPDFTRIHERTGIPTSTVWDYFKKNEADVVLRLKLEGVSRKVVKKATRVRR